MRAVGYCRVSTDEQGDSGLGLAGQETVIRAEVTRRGWEFVTMFTDVASGKSMKKRPDLARALDALTSGEADVLVVAKLDRLSRSVPDFASMLARASAEGWALNICDLGVDTTTPNGKMVAQIMMVLAEWEREMIGARTTAALAAAKEQGTRLGRPRSVGDDTAALIRVLRNGGRGYHSIARLLNEEAVPTGQGAAKWHASTVRAVHLRDVTQ